MTASKLKDSGQEIRLASEEGDEAVQGVGEGDGDGEGDREATGFVLEAGAEVGDVPVALEAEGCDGVFACATSIIPELRALLKHGCTKESSKAQSNRRWHNAVFSMEPLLRK